VVRLKGFECTSESSGATVQVLEQLSGQSPVFSKGEYVFSAFGVHGEFLALPS